MWWLRCGILLAFTGSTWSSAAHLGEVPSQDPTASAAAADERRGLRWHLPVKTGEWTAETGAASSVLRQLPISNFWELDDRPANAHAGAQEGARRRLRDAILKLQQPEDCASANLCTCDYFEAGLFSMVHGRTACLLMALHMNCTLVDVPNEKGNRYMSKGHQYVNQEQCNISTLNSPWECYFAPLSTCQPKNRTIADKHSTQLCKHFHKHAPTVMRQAGLKSPLLLTSELTSYIMRPAPRLSASVQKWASRMGLLAANSTGSNEAEVFSRCLAVHIRHSDKKAVPLSEKQHTAFIGAADDLRSVYGYDVINYMTDDPNVDTLFKVLPKDDKSVRVTTIPAPASRKIWHENEDSPDIGLELFTQVILLAQCNMLLGSVVSNVDQVTLELMATRQWPPSHLDMYGDVYKPCSAAESHTNFSVDSARFYSYLKNS